MTNKKRDNIKINEFLFSLYLFLFPGFSWLFSNNQFFSYFFTLLILSIFIIHNFHDFKISKSLIIINVIVFIIFSYTYIYFNNSLLFQYFKDYILHGFITMLLFTKVKNYDLLLKYMSYVCLIMFVFSFNDPFVGYVKYSNYMSYGLFCILPSFILFHLQRKYYKKKFFVIFECLSLILLLYSNRNSILTCIISVFIFDIFLKENRKGKFVKYILIFLLIFLFLINFQNIIELLLKFTNYNSYAINAIANMLSGTSNGLAHRDVIWSYAFQEIKSHFLLGTGFSYFVSKYGYYCHNLFIELVVSCGIFGICFICFLLKKIVNKIRREKQNIFLLFIVLMGILPLMFNNTFITWKFFWVMLIFLFKDGVLIEKKS